MLLTKWVHCFNTSMPNNFSRAHLFASKVQPLFYKRLNGSSHRQHKGPIRFSIGLLFLALIFSSLFACSPTTKDHTNSQNGSPESTRTAKPQTSHSWHRTSQYLTMRDGVKIAVDLYLPDDLQPGQQIPAILHQTRYWRAIEYRWLISLFKDDRPRGIIGNYAERFLQQGYAWVDVDARGSGASFGTRPICLFTSRNTRWC